jgi:hypothetical protein
MPTLIVKDLSETTFQKLKEYKKRCGLQDKSWAEFFDYLVRDVRLSEVVVEKVTRYSFEAQMPLWCKNFAENLPYIREGKAVNDLEGYGKGKAAIIVGAGPSLWRNKHLELLAESNFDGVVLISDKVLKDALKAGITPDNFDILVGTVDGNRDLIWKLYDDPIIDKYGSKIKALFTTTAAPNARERAEKAGIEIYWFNPVFDDWQRSESFTRLLGMMTSTEKRPKGIGCLRGGGNVGSALWIASFSVLNSNPIGLIGIDLSYLPETPIEETPYYKKILEAAGGDVNLAAKHFIKIYNPYFNCSALLDFIFDSYRKVWLELARRTPREYLTINCSEGGSLFGEPYIYCMRFKDYLDHYKDENLLNYRLTA